ncbi:MAG: rhombosortase [Pseudomonadota bacterium]
MSWQLPALLSVVAVILMAWGDAASLLLRYDRTALAQGEWWRLLTGHVVHLGWSHLLLNLVGLLLVWLLVGEAIRTVGWWLLLLVCAVFICAALWLLYPHLQWYVGLSGLLHGMLFGGAVVLFGVGDKGGALLALLVIVKLLAEQLWGPLPGSEAASGGTVIVEAHLYGALGGGLFVALVWLRPTWRSRLLVTPTINDDDR